MNMKTIFTMTAAALLLAGFAPSDAAARSNKGNHHGGKYKHNNYKHNNYKHHGSSYHFNNYKRPSYNRYKYHRPDYNRSSFSIYGTPYGGLGFSYSEFNGRPYPYYPYYGYL